MKYMNALDVIILVLLGYFTVTGLFRGFVQEAFALGGLVLGVVAANKYHIAFLKAISGYIHNSDLANIAAYVIVFFAVAAAMTLAGKIVSRGVRLIFLGWLDRAFGLALGFLKGLIVACILILIVGVVAREDSALIKDSRLKPMLESLLFFVPDQLIDRLRIKKGSVPEFLKQDPSSQFKKFLS
jgi:membrane protein required for colicin V production